MKDGFHDAEYFDDSYSVFRKDRPIIRGGGVLIATKNDKFSSEQIELSCAEKLEYVCIKASTKSQHVYIYNAYIPPNSSSEIYQAHLAAIKSISTDPEDVVIIVGDFNLPKVEWEIDSDENGALIPTVLEPQFAADFILGLIGIGVYQVNHIRNTKSNRLLDLFFTNDFTNVSIDHAKPLTRVDEYHPPILATFEWHMNTNNNNNNIKPTRAFSFKKGNYAGMNEHLASIDFTISLSRKKSVHGKTKSCRK